MAHAISLKTWTLPALALTATALVAVAGSIVLRPQESEAPRISPPASVQTTPFAKAVVVESRDLRFLPAGGTALYVVDDKTGQQLKHATEDTASFMTTLIKGLNYERRRRELAVGSPYRLIRWSDGRLSLTDLNTDQHVELVAFGTSNAATFAGLLATGRTTR
jgi:putative photosynthetic complex assembly protein